MMRSKCVLLLFLLSISLLRLKNAEVFSSVQHLERLVDSERNAFHVLKKLEMNEILNRYFDEYNLVSNALTPQEIAKNPIHAYHMIKRIKNLISSEHSIDSETLKKIKPFFYGGTLIPTKKDMVAAEFGIVFLTAVHSLDIDDLRRGKIYNYETNLTMKVEDYFRFISFSLQLKLLHQTAEWLELIVRSSAETNDRKLVNIIISLIRDDLLNSVPVLIDHLNRTKDQTSVMTRVSFLSSCAKRGQNQVNAKDSKKLVCYYSDRGSPWLILQPAKVEVLHTEVTMLIFHDVLSDNEIANLKELSVENVERNIVRTRYPMVEFFNRIRKDTKLSEQDHEIVGRIARRMSHVTGLSLNFTKGDSEQLAIINYGLGGWYEPHYDFRPGRNSRGATIMFWLSDVEIGGGTGFPNLNVTLFPHKGSAAFWYNINDEGRVMKHAFHGACPVLIGNKWVATFWVKQIGQIFKRKCPPVPRKAI